MCEADFIVFFFVLGIFAFSAAFPQFGFGPNPQQFPNQFGGGGFVQQFPNQFGGFGLQNADQFGSGNQQQFPNQFGNGGVSGQQQPPNPSQFGGSQLNPGKIRKDVLLCHKATSALSLS